LDKLKALEAAFTFIKTTKDLYTRRNNICLFFLKALRTDDSAINQTKKAQLGTLKQAYLQITQQALQDKAISPKQKQAIIKLAQLSPLIDFNTSYYDDRKNHPTSSRNTLNPMLYDAAKRLSV
jgi:hypothetical protein